MYIRTQRALAVGVSEFRLVIAVYYLLMKRGKNDEQRTPTKTI